MSKFCMMEEYHEAEEVYVDPVDCLCSKGIIKVWDFYYSDGSIETLTMREPVE